MTLRSLLFWLSAGCGAGALVAYLWGVWRRWQPDASGKPAFAREPGRAKEPWLALAVGLLLAALALSILSRVV
jgi:hypothetical protein